MPLEIEWNARESDAKTCLMSSKRPSEINIEAVLKIQTFFCRPTMVGNRVFKYFIKNDRQL